MLLWYMLLRVEQESQMLHNSKNSFSMKAVDSRLTILKLHRLIFSRFKCVVYMLMIVPNQLAWSVLEQEEQSVHPEINVLF